MSVSDDIQAALKSTRIDLPKGVTLAMAEAGMREWDAQMQAGERNWFNMMGRVYAAMHAAKRK